MPVKNAYPKSRAYDFHVHAFPDEVAGKAVDALFTAYQVKAVTDGTISSLVALMEETGLDGVVVQPVATKPGQVRSINDWAASHMDPRVISFGGIHPDYPDLAGEVDRIVSLGLPGIKIQANWQGVFVDDMRMYPIYEAAQGRLTVLFHSGAELTPFPELKATPERLARVHEDFPNLTMVAAHMGGYLMWDESEEHLVGKNIYMDTSACFPHELPDERFLRMIRRHGPERILFATDMPLNDPVTEVRRLAQMGLSDEELSMILWGNARRLLGLR